MPELLYKKAMMKEETISLSAIDEILKKRQGQLVIKRIFDSFFSLLGLISLLPLFIIISIIIKMDSNGPVFFQQMRVGKNGKDFKILKFRTMIVDAEQKGMQITVGNDSRITKGGYFLRKSKLDELPQLINVLVGDMSFVGPRPEVRRYVELYDENQKNILKVRPGITDYASIEYFNENELLGKSEDPEETYIKVIMKNKIQLNLNYLHKISMIEDITLIFRTLAKIFSK